MAAPDEFHDEAHPEAREITGDRRYGEWGQCIATAKTTGERCRGYAQGPHGVCGSHGADGADAGGDVGDPGGAPEGNTNGVTHGAYADENAYYQHELDDSGRELVDSIFQDYVEQYRELHGEPPLGHETELFRISVSHVKDIELDRWASQRPDDLDPGNGLVARETHYTDDGTEYHQYSESVVLSAQKKLSSDRRMWLKDLGLLEDPESQKADAISELDLGLSDAELEALDTAHSDVDPDP